MGDGARTNAGRSWFIHNQVMSIRLAVDFPQLVLGPMDGQWWRVHWARYEPWYFASSDSGRADDEIGRFDLPRPQGTCYVGYGPAAVAAEHIRICGVSAAEAQKAAALRRVSPLGLDRWHGKPIADFTSPAAHDDHGAPGDIALVDRAEARAWAVAALSGGFHGVLYRLQMDPERRFGLALFYDSGPLNTSPSDGTPQRLPVGLKRELHELIGTYRGDDPLAM